MVKKKRDTLDWKHFRISKEAALIWIWVLLLELIEPNDESFPFGYNLRYKSRFEFILNYRGKLGFK